MATTFEGRINFAPFDAVAADYDKTFTASRIGQAQREFTWRELDRIFRPGQRVLEINCGTGVDAIHLAGRGIQVVACDISPRMIQEANRNADRAQRQSKFAIEPAFRVLATEDIGTLKGEGLVAGFDGALSNFAGLNCVENLSAVARDLGKLLKPRATAIFCLFGRFCIWEIFWHLAHAQPGKAFRRLRKRGVTALLAEGATVRVHYPSVSRLARDFAPEFVLKEWKGIGVASPPSYLEHLAQRFPRIFDGCVRFDRRWGSYPILRAMADHMLLTFERRA